MNAIYNPAVESLEGRCLYSSTPVVLPPDGLTPAQVRAAYEFNNITFPGKRLPVAANGAGETIAIVGAYNAPYLAADLRIFDKEFGLPNSVHGASVLRIAKLQGHTSTDADWAQEMTLDVEWSHAIAPGAHILLVEAANSTPQDLANAVAYARRARGVAVVSMSFGYDTAPVNAAEFNSLFTTPPKHVAGLSSGDGVAFVQAAGDDGSSTSWPDATTPDLSVGGTVLTVDDSGNYGAESALTSDGPSATVGYAATTTTSGFDIYDRTPDQGQAGWQVVRGTSAGTPQWAGLIAIVDQGRMQLKKHSLDGISQLLPAIAGLSASDFNSIINGGTFTGRGSPIANRVIADLVILS